MKNPKTPSGIKSATFHLVAQWLKQLRHRVTLSVIFVAKKFTGTKTHLPFAEPSNFSWQPYKRATKYNFWRNVLTMSGSRYLSTVRGGWGICYWIIRIPKYSQALKTKEERRQINARITYSQKTTLLFHPLSLCVIVASFYSPPPQKKTKNKISDYYE